MQEIKEDDIILRLWGLRQSAAFSALWAASRAESKRAERNIALPCCIATGLALRSLASVALSSTRQFQCSAVTGFYKGHLPLNQGRFQGGRETDWDVFLSHQHFADVRHKFQAYFCAQFGRGQLFGDFEQLRAFVLADRPLNILR